MPDDQQSLGSSATLTAGVSSSATTLPLSAAIGVADGRTMRVVCEGEVMLVTAGMGTTSLTVTRGQEGTTAAAHPSSATVQQRLTPAGLANTRTQPNPHAHNGTDGSGTVAHSATTGRTANDHHNQAHSLTGADHTLSGLTTGHVLTATGPTAAAFQAPSGGGAPAAHASSHVGGGSDAIAAFVASGASHKSGLVPDPGVTAGTTKFLREDATFAVPPGTGGGTLTVEEVDGTPSVAATKLILPNGTVSVTGTEATYTPSGGGGGAVTLIASQTVSGSAVAAVTFSSIPSTYKNLRLTWRARTTDAGAQQLRLRLNSDTSTSDYEYDIYGGGFGEFSSTTAGYQRIGPIPGSGATAAEASAGRVEVLYYASASYRKKVLYQCQRGDSNALEVGGGNWKQTAAVDTLTLSALAGNLDLDSTFDLWGES
jgi:hypothetical protein